MHRELSYLRFNRDTVARMIADALMITICSAFALMIWMLWQVLAEGMHADQLPKGVIAAAGRNLIVLLVISFVVFTLSGFYTRGRFYKSRYKIIVITQAITVSYIALGFIGYMVPEILNAPRSTIFIGWFATCVTLVGARFWSNFWKLMAKTESLKPDPDSTVRNVLVIGGAGYIGSALLPKLLAKGYNVRLLDTLLFGKDPIAPILGHPRLEVIRADFRFIDKVVEAVRGMDAVIHLGAIVGDPACSIDEGLTVEVNLTATRVIADVARGSGVKRFIFASTCSVYGASDQILNEESALNPVSMYARSKIGSERVLLEMTTDQFAPTILRFATIYGLSGRTRFDLVVNLLTAKAVVESAITVVDGDQWRPFVHVDDAANGIMCILESPFELVKNEVFNVGCDTQNYTISQVGDMINKLVPNARVVSSGSGNDRRNYRVSFDRIQSKLGFAPQWSIEQGIEQVILALRSGSIKDYRDPIYSNVKYLTEEGLATIVRRHYGWEQEYVEKSETTMEST